MDTRAKKRSKREMVKFDSKVELPAQQGRFAKVLLHADVARVRLPASIRKVIQQTQLNLLACVHPDSKGAPRLPWHDGTAQARGAFACRLVKYVGAYRNWFLGEKLSEQARQALLVELEGLSFDAQFRHLGEKSKLKLVLSAVGDELIFSEVEIPKQEFGAVIFATMPAFARYRRRVRFGLGKGKSDAAVCAMLAAVQCLPTYTEQALVLVALTREKTNLDAIADWCARIQPASAAAVALKKLNARWRGDDILNAACAPHVAVLKELDADQPGDDPLKRDGAAQARQAIATLHRLFGWLQTNREPWLLDFLSAMCQHLRERDGDKILALDRVIAGAHSELLHHPDKELPLPLMAGINPAATPGSIRRRREKLGICKTTPRAERTPEQRQHAADRRREESRKKPKKEKAKQG